MTQEFPAPLTPPNCDLRDFRRMMIDIQRLQSSEFDAGCDDSAWRAGFNLWFSSWHAVPAASLDDNEGALCKAAGLGRDLKTWRRVREAAMRGWVLCSDGRWYHETVAEFALEAWLEKLAQRLSSGAGNAKRWQTVFDAAPVEADIAAAVGLLSALNPDSKSIPKASRRNPTRVPSGSKNNPDGNAVIVPSGSPSGSQEKGKEKGNRESSLRSESCASTQKPNGSKPLLESFESAGFTEFYDVYPLKKGKVPAQKAWAKAVQKAPPETIIAAAKRYALSRHGENPKFTKWPQGWLNEERWRDELQSPALAGNGSPKPPDPRFVQQPGETREHFLVRRFRQSGVWLSPDGAPPDSPDCCMPNSILTEFGYRTQAVSRGTGTPAQP